MPIVLIRQLTENRVLLMFDRGLSGANPWTMHFCAALRDDVMSSIFSVDLKCNGHRDIEG